MVFDMAMDFFLPSCVGLALVWKLALSVSVFKYLSKNDESFSVAYSGLYQIIFSKKEEILPSMCFVYKISNICLGYLPDK